MQIFFPCALATFPEGEDQTEKVVDCEYDLVTQHGASAAADANAKGGPKKLHSGKLLSLNVCHNASIRNCQPKNKRQNANGNLWTKNAESVICCW